MAKKATTLHDNLGNDLLPVTNASITFMDNGNSVQAEINDLKEKTQYNKGHYTTEQELLTAYPNRIQNPQSRKGWYAIVGETDSVWIWDIEGNEWKDSGVSSGGVESVNGLDGEVILTGGNINATATINDTSTTKSINGHLNDIYSELNNYLPLTGGTLTGPVVVSGGDAASGVGNIQFDIDGQITAKGTTSTLFGRSASGKSLLLGHSTHSLSIRGTSIEATASLITRATIPISTNKYNLGSSERNWKEIHGTTIYQDGKQVATMEYVDNAIANSITSAIEGEY